MIERIYIPTIRRAANQITYTHLPDELRQRVIMVIDPAERHLYNYDCQYLDEPQPTIKSWTQLADTRLFIHKHAGAIKYAVADDDLTFKRRNAKYWTGASNMPTSKRDATPEEISSMCSLFDTWLDEPDIGVVGPSNCEAPPPATAYADTKGVFSFVCYDGRMLSKVIDDMDLTSIRVAEDVMFMYEALSRGINSRLSTEWIYDNRSFNSNDLAGTRAVWEDPFDEQPDDHYQTDMHYDALRYIQSKYPHGMKIHERDGKRKNTKYWKKVYNPQRRTQAAYYERIKASAGRFDV